VLEGESETILSGIPAMLTARPRSYVTIAAVVAFSSAKAMEQKKKHQEQEHNPRPRYQMPYLQQINFIGLKT
jgi:hypothetical protein